MSLFTCNHCATFLKKKRVENHFNTACLKGVLLTCNDCKEEFDKFTYGKHANCIPKKRAAAPGLAKGELKQLEWLSVVKGLTTRKGLSQEQTDLLKCILERKNVPRSKPRFQNFIRNLTKGEPNMKVTDEIWNMLEEDLNKKQKSEKILKKDNQGIELNAASKKPGKQVQQEVESMSVDSTETKKKRKSKKKKKNTNESQLENGNLGKRKPGGEQQSKGKGKKRKVAGKGGSQ